MGSQPLCSETAIVGVPRPHAVSQSIPRPPYVFFYQSWKVLSQEDKFTRCGHHSAQGITLMEGRTKEKQTRASRPSPLRNSASSSHLFTFTDAEGCEQGQIKQGTQRQGENLLPSVPSWLRLPGQVQPWLAIPWGPCCCPVCLPCNWRDPIRKQACFCFSLAAILSELPIANCKHPDLLV